MRWREALRKDPEAKQTFLDHLTALQADAVRQMEEAAVWDAVLEARGGKKVLDLLLHQMKMDDQEEASYARTFGKSRATRSA